MPEWNGKIRRDKIVKIVRPDPKSADDRFIVLRGLIGVASEKEHIRIFLDPALNVFIDVSERDVLYAVELGEQQSPIGGSLIWLNLNTIYTYGNPREKSRPKETFLNGRLRIFLRSQAPSAWGPDFLAFADPTEGFDPNCPDPPTIWDNTPCQPCEPVSNPFLPCLPAPTPSSGSRTVQRGFNPMTGYERFNPYDR